MVSSDFRAEAREKLGGKWGKAACFCLAYIAFSFLFGFVLGFISGLLSLPDIIIDIISYIVEIPLTFGFTALLMKLYNNEEAKAFDFVNLAFNNFGRSWGVALRMLLKMIIPIIILTVSLVLISVGTTISILSDSLYSFGISALIGFVIYIVALIWLIYKSYSYQLSYFLAIDNPEMSSKDAVEKSEQLMNGKRFKLFCLQFSFIGWIVLSVLGLGIPLLWILPYMQFAIMAFYKFALGNETNVKAEVIEENNN